MKNYFHSIVCDIDDTISFTTSRDWSNASPNMPVINKLNTLYDAGWHISLYTARGSLSCSTRQEADDTFRPIIESWMKQHNVKYHELSFNKPLATYYVDDKALRPDEFVSLNVETLKGGQSGAIVERRGDKVYKTAQNSIAAAAWYKESETIQGFKTPKIHSLIGDTLCMDYIDNSGHLSFNKIKTIIKSMRSFDVFSPDFKTYVDRIQTHLGVAPFVINGLFDAMTEHTYLYNNEKSFCHGDFTIDNILISKTDYYLIDPIYLKDVYSSWLLDVSKLAHSFRRFNRNKDLDALYYTYSEFKISILILELTQWIRIYKYSNENVKKQTVNEIENIIKEYNATRSSTHTEIKIKQN